MRKEIIAEFSVNGEVKIETIGFKGKACEAASKAVEEMLGIKTSDVKKSEYYQATETTNKQTT